MHLMTRMQFVKAVGLEWRKDGLALRTIGATNVHRGAESLRRGIPYNGRSRERDSMNATFKEPSFRESVDLMFNRAVAVMDLPPGLEEKIRVCNGPIQCALVCVCAGRSRPLQDIVLCTANIWSL